MTRLIGSRWKYRKVLSRGVLISPFSRAELCIARSYFVFSFTYFVYRMLSSVRFWWFNERVIPVLIPNTEVKPLSGDGTHRNRWEE